MSALEYDFVGGAFDKVTNQLHNGQAKKKKTKTAVLDVLLRQVMRARGPVLLHPGFLRQARECVREARAAPQEALAGDLLRRGLFFVAEERWKLAQDS